MAMWYRLKDFDLEKPQDKDEDIYRLPDEKDNAEGDCLSDVTTHCLLRSVGRESVCCGLRFGMGSKQNNKSMR